MNEEAAFVRAMLDAPEDTALRLVFADWLEERGDPRGELLRLTHMLTQAIDVPQRAELEAHMQALLRDGVQPVGPYWTNKIGMRFAWVPAGTFLMGSPKAEAERREDETQHEVTLTRGFWLSVYPVTQHQWQTVMGHNPSWFCFEGGGKEDVKGLVTEDFPVEQVSWDEAMAFCSRLARLEHGGIDTCRLPSEEEWEYACRAGTQTPFHFGATLDGKDANYNGNYPYGTSAKTKFLGRTSEAGVYVANAFGLHDMHGNVWEWTSSVQGLARGYRGGCWLHSAALSAAARRCWMEPTERWMILGFRLLGVPSK